MIALNGIKLLQYCLIFLVAFLVVPAFCYAQNENSGLLNNLTVSNGFGKIYLGESINMIAKDKLVYMDGDRTRDIDGCVKYEYHDMDQINSENNLDLNMVGLRVYNGKIINIYLFFKKENGYQIFQSFESKFGNCTARTGDFTYSWDTYNVKLYLEYDKEYLGVAIYSCKKLYQEIAQNNERRLAAQ